MAEMVDAVAAQDAAHAERTGRLGAADSVLIVGAGLAGYWSALHLRRAGFTGAITILGSEETESYDRPGLSKSVLSSDTVPDLLDDPEQPLDATWLRASAATEILANPLRVRTAAGAEHTADHIIFATGSEPRRLPVREGAQPDRLCDQHVIYSLDDAIRLRERVVTADSVLVVGGSFLALEIAASVASRGVDVTVLASTATPVSSRFGIEAGTSVKHIHLNHGVRFAEPGRAAALHEENGRTVLETEDGRSITADVVVSAIGADPATGWLTGTGLLDAATGAIGCDDTGASVLDGVSALGDCAIWDSQRSGERPRGHWQETIEQAEVLAARLMGHPVPVMKPPYLWSDQYDVRLQAAGPISLADSHEVTAGSIEGADLLITYYRNGEEIGIFGMNRLREITRWRKLQQRRNASSPAAAVAHQPAAVPTPA